MCNVFILVDGWDAGLLREGARLADLSIVITMSIEMATAGQL